MQDRRQNDVEIESFKSSAYSAEVAGSIWMELRQNHFSPLPAPTRDVRDKHTDALAEGEDGFAIVSEAKKKSLLSISMYPGVSKEFSQRVNCFADAIPRHLQKLVSEKGVGITVYASHEQLPQAVRDMQVRRHESGETYAHLPMFFDPVNRRLVFIEKPKLTERERAAEQSFESAEAERRTKGVQTFGKLAGFDAKAMSYEPIERNGWHELGHAIDVVGLGRFSASPTFNAAFMKDLRRLPKDLPEEFKYYASPQMTSGRSVSFDAAREELFAELFTVDIRGHRKAEKRDQRLVNFFPSVMKLISDETALRP